MLKDRLHQRRTKLRLSREALAEKAGVSPSTITFLENGRNESSKHLVEIASALGVTAEWLKDGNSSGMVIIGDAVAGLPKVGDAINKLSAKTEIIGLDPWDSNTPLQDHEVEVPFFKDVNLSAGSGCFTDNVESAKKLRFSKYTLKNKGIDPADTACVNVRGDSMEPVIPNGCTVAINMADTVINDGSIYAINNDGLLQVKILKQLSGSEVSIESYNPSHSAQTKKITDIVVLGKVFWYSVLL